MRKHTFVHELKIGMRVTELDKPWHETPFMFQGFEIQSQEDIDQLKEHCKYVYIEASEADPDHNNHNSQKKNSPSNIKSDLSLAPVYENTTTMTEELIQAKAIKKESSELITDIVKDLYTEENFDFKRTQDTVANVVESVIRNPDAMLWLTHLRDQDSYTYKHAFDMCAYMVTFGRHLGFPRNSLQNLGIGGFLLDLGKMRVSKDILNKQAPLTLSEKDLIKQHVQHTVNILQESSPTISRDIIDIIMNHHERYDGSGYPNALEGQQISLFASMAGIVDTYTAMTSDRSYKKATSSHAALQELYEYRDKYFKDSLVEQFIQCIGIYPIGSLVEMRSGEVGIITSQNRIRQLQPCLMLILDGKKEPLDMPIMLDLTDEPLNQNKAPYSIKRILEPEEYNIDRNDYFL